MYWPMFVVAVLAAIIASQAMISGTFSIVQQSLSLGCFPRVKIIHTSATFEGQVYRTTAKIGHRNQLLPELLTSLQNYGHRNQLSSHAGLCCRHCCIQNYCQDRKCIRKEDYESQDEKKSIGGLTKPMAPNCNEQS